MKNKRSLFVNPTRPHKGVAHWLDHNSVDTLLIAITDGELGWDESIGDFGWREGMPLPRPGRIRG
jgi:hypothetical protein